MATAKKKQEERAGELGGDSDDDLENVADSDGSDLRTDNLDDLSPSPPVTSGLPHSTALHGSTFSANPHTAAHHLGLQ